MATHNWAGNIQYSTSNIHYPESIEQLQELVQRLDNVRVLGTRHTFNTIADSSHHLVFLDRLPRIIDINPEAQTVRISGNVTYGELCPLLENAGFALRNLASLGHISVVGACTTGTHGSGVSNQNLSSVVSAMTIIKADGQVVRLSRDGESDLFNGAVVHLGALGVVTELTLDLAPSFEMQQRVFLNLPFSQLEHHFDDIMASAYSVSLFTDWHEDAIQQVWLKQKLDEDSPTNEFYGALPAEKRMHPIPEMSAENCTEQLGITGLWYDRLPHFRIDMIPSVGNELQSEYFVPRSDALDAIRSLQTLYSQIAPLLFASEIRAVASDSLWLSPCYGRDTIAFHFTWQPDWESVRKILPMVEEALSSFNPRPHWGKLFTIPPSTVRNTYDRFNDFTQLMMQYDPQGKFQNSFLHQYLSLSG